jgi:hypothetical protein
MPSRCPGVVVAKGGYEGPARFVVSMLPGRAAYLIGSKSQSGFRRAIQEATTRWGGMSEPIVPVLAGGRIGSWHRQVVEVSGVDCFVNVDVSDADAQALAARMGLPLVPLAGIDVHGPASFSINPVSLRTNSSAPNGIITRRDSPLWEAVSAGDLTEEHEEGLRSLNANVTRAVMPDQVARNALSARTFLDQSVTSFGENFASGAPFSISTIVWITRPNDFRDCLYFWNLRALRSLRPSQPMLLLPHNEVQHWLEFGRDFATVLARPDEFAPDVVIASFGVPEVRLHEIASILGLEASVRKPRSGHSWPAMIRTPPFDYVTNSVIDVRQWIVFERRYGEDVETDGHIFSGKATLRFPSPVRFLEVGKTFMQLRSSVFDGLPQRIEIAQRVLNAAIWRNGGIHFGVPAMSSDYRFDIQVPTPREAVDLVLRTCTSSYVLSDKGLLATAMGTDAKLDVLLEPNIYEAICELRTPRSKTLKRELEREYAERATKLEIQELVERWGGRSERRYRSATELGLPLGEGVAALERLCGLGWAERGFAISCQRCGVRSFVPVGDVTGPAHCPGCGSSQGYTNEMKKTGASGIAVFYRLNSFVDRASDQGVLPHLLVVAALTRRDDNTWLLPGVDVKFGHSQTVEVDVVGVHGGKLISGEVKSSAQDFTTQQIKRDIELSKRLTADVHVMASLDAIPKETIAEAQKAADRAGLELLILTCDDLRPSSLPRITERFKI